MSHLAQRTQQSNPTEAKHTIIETEIILFRAENSRERTHESGSRTAATVGRSKKKKKAKGNEGTKREKKGERGGGLPPNVLLQCPLQEQEEEVGGSGKKEKVKSRRLQRHCLSVTAHCLPLFTPRHAAFLRVPPSAVAPLDDVAPTRIRGSELPLRANRYFWEGIVCRRHEATVIFWMKETVRGRPE